MNTILLNNPHASPRQSAARVAADGLTGRGRSAGLVLVILIVLLLLGVIKVSRDNDASVGFRDTFVVDEALSPE
jgi:hypothetical protein